MNRILKIVLAVVGAVVLGVACFYGGMVYGQSQSASARTQAGRFGNGQGGYVFQGRGGNGQGNAQGGGGFGQITEIGDGYMVIADNNGNQTRVTVTDTTLIEKNASVELTDLSTGETVMVSGSTASDGSITARNVQVAPAGRFGGPNGGQAPSGQNNQTGANGNQDPNGKFPPPPPGQ